MRAVREWHTLTYHDRLVVRLLAYHGLTNAQMGRALGVSREAVKRRMTRIYLALGFPGTPERKRLALVAWAWRQPMWWSEDDLAEVAA